MMDNFYKITRVSRVLVSTVIIFICDYCTNDTGDDTAGKDERQDAQDQRHDRINWIKQVDRLISICSPMMGA